MSTRIIGYYVYAYIRKSNGTPYYIGKGKDDRCIEPHASISVPKDRSKIVIIEQNLTEIGALAIERRLIRWYGRKDCGNGILQNRTDGGDGASGRKCSSMTREKMRINGLSQSSVTRAKISSALKGRPVSAETRSKLRMKNLGKKHTTDTKEKMKKSAMNRRGSVELLQKYSAATKGTRWWTNGQRNARAKECPGINWKPGRSKS